MDLRKVKPSKNVFVRKPADEKLYWQLMNYFDPTWKVPLDELSIPLSGADRKNLDEGRVSITDLMFKYAVDENRGNILNQPVKGKRLKEPSIGPMYVNQQMIDQLERLERLRNPKKKIF